MERIGNVINEKQKREQAPVQAPVRYAHEDEADKARREIWLRSQAGQPLIVNGSVRCKCKVCHDMRYLRADVPVGHKLFGHIRLCPCHPRYAEQGGEWFQW